MSIPKKPIKNARNLFRQMKKPPQAALKGFVNWVLRTLLRIGKRPNLARAGFALPTTMMVILVVALLTTTMVIRSLDRNRNAINARSEQVIQNSSTPAIDRANAKLAELLVDPELPRGTPPDDKLIEVMKDERYTFGDETRLKVGYDFASGNSIGKDGSIRNNPANPKLDETINTAWRYPVDTDGNGKFDSFTLYGLYWRNPKRTAANFNRGRVPLEARSLPQETKGVGDICDAEGASAAVATSDSDWFPQGKNQSKAFYAYAATVPITDVDNISYAPFNRNQFENNSKGNKAFSGLEYQQDRYRSGLNNTAVWTDNDLVLNPGDNFRLNGRVFTNANLMIGSGAEIQLFQVSDPYSCFYEKANAQINVGGNVIYGDLTGNTPSGNVFVHLYQGPAENPASLPNPKRDVKIEAGNQSTNDPGSKIAYNDAAYEKRISLMTQTALYFCDAGGCASNPADIAAKVNGTTQYPDAVKQKFNEDINADPSNQDKYSILEKDIDTYLRSITRRVPYAEIPSPSGDGAITGFTPNAIGVDASVFTGKLDPVKPEWRELTNTGVALNDNNLPQNNPDKQKQKDPEREIGDRVRVGNNLPTLWKKIADGKYEATPQEPKIPGASWSDGGERYRQTQAQEVQDVGKSNRNGYWETAAAADPSAKDSKYSGGGGLRAITGAGIYTDGLTPGDGAFYPRNAGNPAKRSFLPEPTWDNKYVDPTGSDATDDPRLDPTSNASVPENNIPRFLGRPNIVVWPDLMPMKDGSSIKKGDLRMRATAIYHYANNYPSPNPVEDKPPIACVSSYYDPTDKFSARNPVGLPDVSGGIDTDNNGSIDTLYDGTPAGPQPNIGRATSNNGVTYRFPGRGVYQAKLERQAQLVFPNGRIANKPLRDALRKQRQGPPLTMADNSAIDAAICAIAILDEVAVQDNSAIPDGAFKESSFLDAREVKAADKLLPRDTNYKLEANYDLPLEERQPLEVRVTDIDLRLLAQKAYKPFDIDGDGTKEPEYLLPNSGIIYASRDDALLDLSSDPNPSDKYDLDKESATDFKLDSTRRPNGIRIINGLRLARGTSNNYNYPGGNNKRNQEKGLILATNTPVYVKGHLNLHLPSNPAKTTFDPDNEKELEEFKTSLTNNWDNFYTRSNNSRTANLEYQFACRQGQAQGTPSECTGTGDQWRPATIIADAVTLQSQTYKEGYRNQGDFDVSNILGTASYIDGSGSKSLAGSRVGQGFFNNSFATSAAWFDTTTNLPSTQVSYALNGVTPIQRRANVFAYATETCQLFPVSTCTATNWTADGLNTARIPPLPPDQRYARRVAFQRNGSKYVYNANGYPLPVDVTTIPRPNALWFKTREDTAGTASFNGTTNRKLFIFQPPEVPDLGLLRGYAVAGSNNYAKFPINPNQLTQPITASAGLTTGASPAAVTTQITTLYNSIFSPTAGTPLPLKDALAKVNTYVPKNTPIILDINALPPEKKTQITGGGEMAVYTASNLFLSAPPQTNRTLTLKGDPSTVFVFLIDGNFRVNEANALTLQGVLPENVYWILKGPLLTVTRSTLYGNVLTTTATINLSAQAKLEGRALSTQSVTLAKKGTFFAQVIAPDGNQPRLVPVTQLNVTVPAPTVAPTLPQPDNNAFRNNWLQQPKSTNYNAAFVVGNSPDRPGESSAGLHNLVRFQENWSPEGAGTQKQTATIKGSFIQTRRSTYATAPYGAIRRREAAGMLPPLVEDSDGKLSIFDYKKNAYPSGVAYSQGDRRNNTVSYFTPPTRQWGFDVGLLSQTPDLFSQRFTENISKTQNYYRQVGRDDPWIKALLCAAQPTNPNIDQQRAGGSGTTYTKYAVPDSERPNCTSPDVVGAPLPYPPNS